MVSFPEGKFSARLFKFLIAQFPPSHNETANRCPCNGDLPCNGGLPLIWVSYLSFVIYTRKALSISFFFLDDLFLLLSLYKSSSPCFYLMRVHFLPYRNISPYSYDSTWLYLLCSIILFSSGFFFSFKHGFILSSWFQE